MSIEVTEEWSPRQLVQNDKDWKATRVLMVLGVTDEMSALAAVDPVNAAHPLNSLLAVKTRTAERPGFNLFKVTLGYAIPPDASKFPDKSNPLADPPRFMWDPGNISEPIDRDIYGNPILNSAGDAFSRDASSDFGTLFLRVTRNQPFYDVKLHLLYQNRLNSDAFVIPLAGTVGPGQCRCVHIKPKGEYTLGAQYVAVETLFELRAGTGQDPDGIYDGFSIRLLDNGTRSFDVNQKKGELFDTQRTRVSQPVLLDGAGKPLDASSFTVYGTDQPHANPAKLPDGVFTEKTDSAVFLKYRRFKPLPFSPLLA
jgi:hypothetical protein